MANLSHKQLIEQKLKALFQSLPETERNKHLKIISSKSIDKNIYMLSLFGKMLAPYIFGVLTMEDSEKLYDHTKLLEKKKVSEVLTKNAHLRELYTPSQRDSLLKFIERLEKNEPYRPEELIYYNIQPQDIVECRLSYFDSLQNLVNDRKNKDFFDFGRYVMGFQNEIYKPITQFATLLDLIRDRSFNSIPPIVLSGIVIDGLDKEDINLVALHGTHILLTMLSEERNLPSKDKSCMDKAEVLWRNLSQSCFAGILEKIDRVPDNARFKNLQGNRHSGVELLKQMVPAGQMKEEEFDLQMERMLDMLMFLTESPEISNGKKLMMRMQLHNVTQMLAKKQTIQNNPENSLKAVQADTISKEGNDKYAELMPDDEIVLDSLGEPNNDLQLDFDDEKPLFEEKEEETAANPLMAIDENLTAEDAKYFEYFNQMIDKYAINDLKTRRACLGLFHEYELLYLLGVFNEQELQLCQRYETAIETVTVPNPKFDESDDDEYDEAKEQLGQMFEESFGINIFKSQTERTIEQSYEVSRNMSEIFGQVMDNEDYVLPLKNNDLKAAEYIQAGADLIRVPEFEEFALADITNLDEELENSDYSLIKDPFVKEGRVLETLFYVARMYDVPKEVKNEFKNIANGYWNECLKRYQDLSKREFPAVAQDIFTPLPCDEKYETWEGRKQIYPELLFEVKTAIMREYEPKIDIENGVHVVDENYKNMEKNRQNAMKNFTKFIDSFENGIGLSKSEWLDRSLAYMLRDKSNTR